jgi:threonine dehydrogenase-like Zn-dependent dehydrogenase
MRALTVRPAEPHSLTLRELPDPTPAPGELTVRTLAVGVCGTDRQLIAGEHGLAPDGETHLVIGHEALGQVTHVPFGSRFSVGDLVVGVVRRPDPVPCASCAAGEWDMCQNGLYTERGIKGRHGYASDMFTLEEPFAVAVPHALRATAVLLEPMSVVAKAWEQIELVGKRLSAYQPRRALVTGAGPIGLLAALMGVQRGYQVQVLDRAQEGPKPRLVQDLGATYCTSLSQLSAAPEIVVECTGDAKVAFDALHATSRNGIVCMTGLSSGAHRAGAAAGELGDALVLENDVVLGSVNANLRHFTSALHALSSAPQAWLERMLTRRVPVARYAEAFEPRPDDIKVVIDWAA